MYTMALYQPRPYRSRAKDDQQHIRQTLVQLVQDLTHLSDILMSQQSPEDSINAARAVKWMSQELDAFVQYLQHIVQDVAMGHSRTPHWPLLQTISEASMSRVRSRIARVFATSGTMYDILLLIYVYKLNTKAFSSLK